MKNLFAAIVFLFGQSPAIAGEPEIKDVGTKKVGMIWNISVTVEHPDSGWDHYVDGWEVIDADGNRLGYRKLLHPHVDEQPFTRSLTGVAVPADMRTVFIRAHCSVHGWMSTPVKVELSTP